MLFELKNEAKRKNKNLQKTGNEKGEKEAAEKTKEAFQKESRSCRKKEKSISENGQGGEKDRREKKFGSEKKEEKKFLQRKKEVFSHNPGEVSVNDTSRLWSSRKGV